MDNLTRKQRSHNMRQIRAKNTDPERRIAKELRRLKVYAARNVSQIIGKPDFVFRRKKVVVFIDSDFWHGHPVRCIMPKSNQVYWNAKIKRNRARDRAVTKELRSKGWKVLRIWEYAVKQSPEKVTRTILRTITQNC